jgi:hypothetical protein
VLRVHTFDKVLLVESDLHLTSLNVDRHDTSIERSGIGHCRFDHSMRAQPQLAQPVVDRGRIRNLAGSTFGPGMLAAHELNGTLLSGNRLCCTAARRNLSLRANLFKPHRNFRA